MFKFNIPDVPENLKNYFSRQADSLRRLRNNLLNIPFVKLPHVVAEIPDKETFVGVEFNLDVSNNFGDLDNNINRYNASGLPEGLTINSSVRLV
ncbi:MAG: hypothetical protein GDA48_18175 [Hormoscilla sp. GM102CHS1]|nr:hypothetical protein [Hormoscilla sp. GM102CHS1]